MPIGLERLDEAFRDVDRKGDAKLFDFDEQAHAVEHLHCSGIIMCPI